MSDFSAIERPPSLASRVVDELLEAITSGRLRPGAPLPTERALSEQFGVSRTVVREAIRGLQAKGVIASLPGRGAVVSEVSSTQVAETVEFYVRTASSQDLIRPTDISEVRNVLELTLTGLASERATGDDLSLIETELRAMRAARTPEEAAEHDEAFHRAIALATHNALFVTLMDAINGPFRSIRVRSLRVKGRTVSAAVEHEAVYLALRSGDAQAARDAMTRHLEDSSFYYGENPLTSDAGPAENVPLGDAGN